MCQYIGFIIPLYAIYSIYINKHKNLKPNEVKKKLKNACIDLKDSKDKQGARLLNLKLLFEEEENYSINIPSKTMDLGRELFESLIIILVILFLLDWRI